MPMPMPTRSAPRLALALLTLALSPLVAAQSALPLQERMSPEQFQAAGLNKLSAEELAALNAWLQQEEVEVSRERIGLRPAPPPAESVNSRLPGEFRGWSGKTVFTLENGQVWQQVGTDQWSGVRLQNPEISIEPALMGSWRLRVKGYNSSTKVKRIR